MIFGYSFFLPCFSSSSVLCCVCFYLSVAFASHQLLSYSFSQYSVLSSGQLHPSSCPVFTAKFNLLSQLRLLFFLTTSYCCLDLSSGFSKCAFYTSLVFEFGSLLKFPIATKSDTMFYSNWSSSPHRSAARNATSSNSEYCSVTHGRTRSQMKILVQSCTNDMPVMWSHTVCFQYVMNSFQQGALCCKHFATLSENITVHENE